MSANVTSQRSYTIIGADGKSYVTSSVDQLRRWVAEGRIVANTAIQTSDTTQLQPAAELPELGDLFRSEEFVASGEQKIPWERREELGLAKSIKETIVGVLFRPAKIFHPIQHPSNFWDPIFFWVVMIVASNCVDAAITTIRMLIGSSGSLTSVVQSFATVKPSTIVLDFSLRVVVIIVFCLFVVLAHITLRRIGGSRQSFEATVSVFCYVSGSLAVVSEIINQFWILLIAVGNFQWVWYPLGYAYLLWQTICVGIGLQRTHQIATKKILAAFFPLIVLYLIWDYWIWPNWVGPLLYSLQ